jgi:hypothetical protein
MTLLGVGSGAALSSTLNSTAGGIGTGYQYAAWKGQIAYTTPNFSGFQATVGITNPNQIDATYSGTTVADGIYQPRFGLEGKASYSFATDAAMKSNGMTGVYDVISKKVSLTSNCKDCEVGLQPLNQDCEIKNGIWMQAAQMTKTITSPLNGGKACNFDTTTQYIGCEKDKDCIII